MQDNYCPDSIILWYAHTIFKACMYMIRRALSGFTCGAKNPLSTNTCQHRNTCLCQRHTSPIKDRLVSVHIK